ncbi:MAG: Wzz/FepE/Etk N-terminal domain-containing protein, partial [Odoribacter splanchnicus]
MENEEIDLIEIMAKLWHRRRTIVYIALSFLVGGLVLAFFLPRKYTAQCTLGLEMEDRTTRISVEGMSPFQSMPMGDMRNTRIVSPAMYPDIFFSVPFQKELIYSPLYIDGRGDTVTFYNYLVSGPERLDLVTDPSRVEQLTEEESKCLAYLKDAFSVKVNNKDGNLKISVDLPDPKLAAYLTNRAQAMLQTYIARFRIAKAQAALDFVEERYTEVKNELEKK